MQLVNRLASILGAFLLTVNIATAQTVITVAFDDFSGNNLNLFQLNSAASANGSNLQLTPSSNGQSGSAFLKNKVTLANNRSFSAYFDFLIDNGSCGGSDISADGLAFVIQTVSNSAGSAGGGIGYQGITPSLAVEFDTYNNGASDSNNGNHTGIGINGNTSTVGTTPIANAFDNGVNKAVWIDYNGTTSTMEIRYATWSGITRPARPVSADVSYVFTGGNIPSALFDQDVYVGFSSATGGCRARHQILSFFFNNDIVAGGLNPDGTTYVSAPALVTANATPSSIVSDGTSSSTISATVFNVSNTPLAGETVLFTTDLGTLSSASAVTDGSGVATTTLTSSTGGSATVRASANGGAYGEVVVSIVTPTPMPTVAPPVVSTPTGGNTTTNPLPTIRGNAIPGATVEVYIDGQLVGTTTAGSDGSWSLALNVPLSPGTRTITAFQTVEGNRSQISEEGALIISSLPVLDFDGDGITDPGAFRQFGSSLKFRWVASLNNEQDSAIVKGRYPVPADYLANGKTQPAAVSANGDRLTWTILEPVSNEITEVRFGRKGSTIVSGCRFVTPDRSALAVVNGRKLRARNASDQTVKTVTLSNLDVGDVIGCGDTDGDGIDELITRTPGTSRQVDSVVIYFMNGTSQTGKRINRFAHGISVRRPGNQAIPLLALARGLSSDQKGVSMEALSGSFRFPVIAISSKVDFTGGIFLDSTGEQIAGLLSRAQGKTQIVKRIFESGSTDTKVFGVERGERLTRSINVIKK